MAQWGGQEPFCARTDCKVVFFCTGHVFDLLSFDLLLLSEWHSAFLTLSIIIKKKKTPVGFFQILQKCDSIKKNVASCTANNYLKKPTDL